MKLSSNLNSTFQANFTSINKTSQNTMRNKNRIVGSPLQRDIVSISPQGKATNIINNLMKQKVAIQDRKSSFMSSALENGKSMESIQTKLDSYDEQIKEIDKQIAEISANQIEKSNENKKSSVEKINDESKAEQEIQNQKMQNLMKISMGMDNISTIDAVKTKFDGSSAVLETEIELDKMRSNGSSGSIERKEKQLADMKQQSMELASEIGEQISDLSDEIEENNNSIEKDSVSAEITQEFNQNFSDEIQNNIEQYKYIYTDTKIPLIDTFA